MRFRRIGDGSYVALGTEAFELIRTLDDSDGYERREWSIWTAGRGRCIGLAPTLNEAKTKIRRMHDNGDYRA